MITAQPEFPSTRNETGRAAIGDYWARTDIRDRNQADMDKEFILRRNPDEVFYVDGHHSITTSNHNMDDNAKRSMLEKFAPGLISSVLASLSAVELSREDLADYLLQTVLTLPPGVSYLAAKGELLQTIDIYYRTPKPVVCLFRPDCVRLSTTSNEAGFVARQENGRMAYEQLVGHLLKVTAPGKVKVRYHIDVVAHSMGFAYAQGLIEALSNSPLKEHIKWGGYYIIAPENGSAGTVNVDDWEQIWQYGSDLGQADADPMWEQDGVAPQTGITGINANPTKGGRAFIPKNQGIPKGFLESHSISNYGWIFGQPQSQPGYVIPR